MRHFLFFVVITLLIVCGLAADPVYRKDYTYIAKYDAFYKAHRTPQNWTTAVAYCEGEGSELIVPLSKEEIEDVGKLLKEGAYHFYVGIHDLFSEGEFITLNGSSADDFYLNWKPGEPNDSNNEDCVAVTVADAGYNDAGCGGKEFFICKRRNSGISINEICETPDKDYFYSPDLDRCYKFHSVPLSWHNAFRKCRSEEANLAIINSRQEANLFVAQFAKYPPNYSNENFDKTVIHLGFNELINPGQFLTIEGKPIRDTGYSNWGANQPDNRANVEHCGSMFRDGTLNDVDCSFRAMFMCEKKLSTYQNVDLRVGDVEIKI